MRDELSSNEEQSGHRDIVLASAGLTTTDWASLTSKISSISDCRRSSGQPLFCPGNTLLFQGDSITDSGRERDQIEQANHQPSMGGGYAWMAASQLLLRRSGDHLKIFNRGVGGNQVHQLADRWQEDCLDLKPDILSILIGVNDFWQTLSGNNESAVEVYESGYRTLLERTKMALTDVRLVVCEPFVLNCGKIDEKWFPAFDKYRAAARNVSELMGAVLVPFQTVFDMAIHFAPPKHWSEDGVHPTDFGHSLMAYTWLAATAV